MGRCEELTCWLAVLACSLNSARVPSSHMPAPTPQSASTDSDACNTNCWCLCVRGDWVHRTRTMKCVNESKFSHIHKWAMSGLRWYAAWTYERACTRGRAHACAPALQFILYKRPQVRWRGAAHLRTINQLPADVVNVGAIIELIPRMVSSDRLQCQ